MISRNLIKIYTVSIIFVLTAIVVAILSIFNQDNEKTQIPFDSNEWKYMKETERYTMYEDLVNNHNLMGMDCSDVEILLGEKSITYDPNDVGDNNFFWGYTIRNGSFEGEEVILIHFENNKVSEVEKEYLWTLS